MNTSRTFISYMYCIDGIRRAQLIKNISWLHTAELMVIFSHFSHHSQLLSSSKFLLLLSSISFLYSYLNRSTFNSLDIRKNIHLDFGLCWLPRIRRCRWTNKICHFFFKKRQNSSSKFRLQKYYHKLISQMWNTHWENKSFNRLL